MNLCEPVRERHSVFHSYACRKGKGRLQAIDAAQKAARGHDWVLKLDIRKYFESISQERLIARLQRLFKDPEVMHWLEQIICGRRTAILAVSESGLPAWKVQGQASSAGKMPASQDRLEACPSLSSLRSAHRQPDEPAFGELNRRSKVRYWRRLRLLAELHEESMISARALQERLTALTAFVLPVRSHGFRRGVMEKLRSAENAARDANPLGLMGNAGCFPGVEPVGPTPGFETQSRWD